MNVICIDEPAFYELIKQVVERLKVESTETEPNWIDGNEAMKILNCKKTKLQELRLSGEITYSHPSKKIIVYYRPSLIEYLNKHLKDRF